MPSKKKATFRSGPKKSGSKPVSTKAPKTYKSLLPLGKKLKQLQVLGMGSSDEKFMSFVEAHLALEYAEKIISAIEQPLIVLDENLKIISANHSFYDTFKVKPKEIKGKLFYKLGKEEWDIPELKKSLEKLTIEDIPVQDFEVKQSIPIIGERTLHLTARTIYTRAEKARFILLGIKDVTELKKAEESASQLASFPQMNPMPILEIDPSGRVLYMNPAARKLFPDLPKKRLGHPYLKGILSAITELKASKKEWIQREVEINGVRYAQTIIAVDKGARIRIYAADITEHKKAEEALRRAKEEWERTFQSVPDLIAILDDEHRIVRVNQAMAQRLGKKPEQCVGLRCYECVHGTTEPPEFCPHVLTLRDGQEHLVEVHEDHLGGDFLVSTTPLLDESGNLAGSVHVARDITERKRTEELLKSSEERARDHASHLQALLDVAPAVIWIAHDRECRKITANRFGEEMLRVREGTNVSKSGPEKENLAHYRVFRDGKELAPEQMPVQQVAASGKGLHGYSLDIVFDDGSVRSLLGDVTPLLDPQGQPDGAIAVFMDVTERRKETQTLRETTSYLENLFNYANAPIICWDTESKITRFNHAFEHLTDYKAEEVIGKDLSMLFPEETKEESLSKIRQTLSGEYWEVVEIPILRKDEEVRIALWNSANVYAEDGKTIIATIAQGQDITERKRVMDSLRETTEYLENLFNYANAPIICWDTKFKITRFNQAFEHLTDYKAEEVIGKDLDILFPADSKEESLGKIRQTLSGEHWEVVEIPILRKDGEVRLALWNSANVYAEDGKTIVATIAQGQDITERKKGEEKILKEKEFLESLIDSLPGVFYTIDSNARMLLTNNRFSQVTGYSADEILHMTAVDFFSEKEKALIAERVKEVFDKGISYAEASFLSKDGKTIPYYFTGARIIRDGVPLLIGMGIDMTERRKMEDALRETTNYLENLFNYANAPIICWDTKFKITRFNHAFEHLTDYKAEEVIGKDLGILFPEETKEESLKKIRLTLSGEYWEVVEIPILRKDGEVRVALWNSANVYAEDGKTIIATIAQGQDITQRKQAEETLRQTTDYLEKLLNYANAPIICWDTKFKITRFNHAFEHLTDYKAEEVIGKDLSMLFPADSKKESLGKIRQTLSGEYWEVVEVPILRKDGEVRIALWNSANVYSEDGKTIIATIAQGQDITQRKKAEEDIRALNESLKAQTAELAASNKELEAFSYSVSHDLRAPLRNIDGFSQALLEDYTGKLDEKGQNYLKRVRAAAQRMDGLIDDLLNLSVMIRKEMRRQEIDLGEQARIIVEELKNTAPERKAEVKIQGNLRASGDPLLLHQLLENLLGNSWKFTSKSTLSRIEFGSDEKDGKKIFFVKDNGVGFDMKYVNKMFIPFQRLHSVEEFSGNGIGLAIVKRIVDRHGGRVWAEGEVGKGATFYFTFE